MNKTKAMPRKIENGKFVKVSMKCKSIHKPSFNSWYQENKESDDLWERYQELKAEVKMSGGRAPSFKQWMKQRFDYLKKYERI